MMYPGLTQGAIAAIITHGTDEQKAIYLPKLVAGAWTGTMNLTEPHCGTDLGLLRTKAVPQGDGTYRISGQKIFISAGEHDLAENIVHLVLARIEGAPAGRQGHQPVHRAEVHARRTTAIRASATRSPAARRREDGHPRQRHLRDELRGGDGWLIGEENGGLQGDVRDDERGAARRRPAGAGPGGGRLPDRRRLRQGPPAGPLADRAEEAGRAGRPDHRPPRHPPHADDHAGPSTRPAAPSCCGPRCKATSPTAPPTRRRARRPTTTWA